MALFDQRQTFAVPATANTYAPERLTLSAPVGTITPAIIVLTALVSAAPAGAVAELWLPTAGQYNPAADGDFALSSESITGTGDATWPLAGIRGAQIRVRSGGTAGTAALSVTAN